MPKNWINFRFLHICPVEKCEISPNLAKFHISPHLLCGKTEIPLHVEKFHVLKSEISPHGRFFLHLHVGDRGDKYQVCQHTGPSGPRAGWIIGSGWEFYCLYGSPTVRVGHRVGSRFSPDTKSNIVFPNVHSI